MDPHWVRETIDFKHIVNYVQKEIVVGPLWMFAFFVDFFDVLCMHKYIYVLKIFVPGLVIYLNIKLFVLTLPFMHFFGSTTF